MDDLWALFGLLKDKSLQEPCKSALAGASSSVNQNNWRWLFFAEVQKPRSYILCVDSQTLRAQFHKLESKAPL